MRWRSVSANHEQPRGIDEIRQSMYRLNEAAESTAAASDELSAQATSFGDDVGIESL